MVDIVTTAKEHPIATGAIVIGGIVILYLVTHASAGSSTLQSQIDSENFQLESQAGQEQTQVSLANIAKRVTNRQNFYNYALGESQIGAEQNIVTQEISLARTQSLYQYVLGVLGIKTQGQEFAEQTGAEVEIAKAQYGAQSQGGLFGFLGTVAKVAGPLLAAL